MCEFTLGVEAGEIDHALLCCRGCHDFFALALDIVGWVDDFSFFLLDFLGLGFVVGFSLGFWGRRTAGLQCLQLLFFLAGSGVRWFEVAVGVVEAGINRPIFSGGGFCGLLLLLFPRLLQYQSLILGQRSILLLLLLSFKLFWLNFFLRITAGASTLRSLPATGPRAFIADNVKIFTGFPTPYPPGSFFFKDPNLRAVRAFFSNFWAGRRHLHVRHLHVGHIFFGGLIFTGSRGNALGGRRFGVHEPGITPILNI